MTEIKNIQEKAIKLVIVPTWVTATLKDRRLTYRDLLKPEVRNDIFSKEELGLLQLANRSQVTSTILGDGTKELYGNLLYQFDGVYFNSLIVERFKDASFKNGTYATEEVLFGDAVPEGYVLTVEVEILDDDDHLDVIVAVFARNTDDQIKQSQMSAININKVADALYVRNFPLTMLTQLGLFRI